MVIWIIGMSGAGKTTVGQAMIKQLRNQKKEERWVFLDGDVLRQITGNHLGHSIEDRLRNGEIMIRTCAMLDQQGIHVVACILSLFPEHQAENPTRFSHYRELYIKVGLDELKQRDTKGLYENALAGKIDDVVGVQIPFPEPKHPDYVLENNDFTISPDDLATQALVGLKLIQKKPGYPYTDHDLLVRPQKYQYTKFEGADFLEAYHHNRTDALAKLTLKISRVPHAYQQSGNSARVNVEKLASFLLRDLDSSLDRYLAVCVQALAVELAVRPPQALPTKNAFVTRHFLTTQLTQISEGEWSLNACRETLLTLVQRFEVCKKVVTHYSQTNLRKETDDYSDLTNFVLFHHLLLSAIPHADIPMSLVFENAALKLGDLLVSCLHRFPSIGQQAFIHASLTLELNQMREQHYV